MCIKGDNICYDQRYETLMIVRTLANYTAAGDVLCLTPSAVSRQIHSIEQELGFLLFTYDGKKLIPTKECDLVSQYVSHIHHLKKKMCGELSLDPGEKTHLVIGATPSTEESILSDVLDCYRARHRETQITLHSGNCEELQTMLCSQALDFAVAEGEMLAEQIHFVVLDTDCLVVAVAGDSPYADAMGITLQQLKKENLIMRTGRSGTRVLFDANIKKEGLSLNDFRIMMELENVSTIKKLVAENYGVSVLSQKACMRDVQQGVFKTIPLIGVNMVRTIKMFYHRDHREEKLLREITQIYESIDFLQKQNSLELE